MVKMDDRLVDLLNCPGCGQPLFQEDEASLSCRQCPNKYVVKKGTPIMYAGETSPADLQYDSKPAGVAHPQSRLRARLRALNLEAPLRRLWHGYLSLSRRLEPESPADPIYWMKKINAALPANPKRVLDLGGGGGPYKRFLSGPGDLYVILEVDYQSYTVQQNIDRHQYIIGDGHQLLFANASFDVISMFEVLEHVRNPFAIFANCARWLKPQGLVVLSVPQYWHMHGWPQDYFRYTIYGLREMANLNGLEIIDYWPMGGPCVLIWCVIDLNFSAVVRLPIIKQLLRDPLLLIARLGDRLFFRNNLSRRHPDTRGWVCIMRKTALSSLPAAA